MSKSFSINKHFKKKNGMISPKISFPRINLFTKNTGSSRNANCVQKFLENRQCQRKIKHILYTKSDKFSRTFDKANMSQKFMGVTFFLHVLYVFILLCTLFIIGKKVFEELSHYTNGMSYVVYMYIHFHSYYFVVSLSAKKCHSS